MTKQQFDTYKFSVKTEALVKGEWTKVLTVAFNIRMVFCYNSRTYSYKEIEELRG